MCVCVCFVQTVSPPRYESTPIAAYRRAASDKGRNKERRQRVPYTDQEVRHLLQGVQLLGTSWTRLLSSFPFHPSRTAVDLKDKYKRMQVSMRLYGEPVWPSGKDLGSIPLRLSFLFKKVVVCGHTPVTLSITSY